MRGRAKASESADTSRRRIPTLGLLCVPLLVAAGFLLHARLEPKPKVVFCAGVGLLGPPGATPSEAFSGWLSAAREARDASGNALPESSSQPPENEWKQVGSTFTNRTYEHPGGYGLRSVGASPGGHDWPPGTTPYGPDQWSIEGGCV
jgi:hypothetical protein